MAWPCITRACCIARFWNQLDKADISVPLVFTRYSEATDVQPPSHHHQLPVQHGPRVTASLPAIETQPSLAGGGGDPDVAAAGLPTEFSSCQTPARSGGGHAPPTPGSVMRQDYKPWRVKPEPSCKPKSEYSPSETPFEKETQYQKDFRAWPIPRRGDHPWIPKPSPAPSVAGDRSTSETKKKVVIQEVKVPEEGKVHERPGAGEKGERAKAEDRDPHMPKKGRGGPAEVKGQDKMAAGEKVKVVDKDPQMPSKGKGGPIESKGLEKLAAGDRMALDGRDPQLATKGKGGPIESKGQDWPAAGERGPVMERDPQMATRGKTNPADAVEPPPAAGERIAFIDKEPDIPTKGKGGPIESKGQEKAAAGERTVASDKEPLLPSKGKGGGSSTPGGDATEKNPSAVEVPTGSLERRGRAVVDALNRQIKEEIGPGTSYRNEFRAWTDVKPVKAFKAQSQYKPPEDKVVLETSYKATFKGEFIKPVLGDNKLTERRRIRSLYSEPYKEPTKVEKPSVQTSKPKKTTTTHKPLKKAKDKLIVPGRATKKKSAESPTVTKPEDKEKSKEMNNKLAEAKETNMPPENRTQLPFNEMDLDVQPDVKALLL